ncbi:MAG: galactokinase [Ruminococcus sp.]|nr:galactokinase [Ruminococcus sp.]
MYTVAQAKAYIAGGALDARLEGLYGCCGEALAPYRTRLTDAVDAFVQQYGSRFACPPDEIPVQIFSVSGRTELGGNHTDHQHGRVLAAGVSLDVIAVASPVAEPVIAVKSEGYPEDVISTDDLSVQENEIGRSAALIRGTAALFAERNISVGGFVAYTTSSVLKGSGLSSSAAFEVMLGAVCNHFFAQDALSLDTLAIIAQGVENRYFGKPCGLMDQMACALGGVVAIDFADPAKPVWEQVTLDFAKEGYAFCIIDTGGDHADLTDDYAAIPAEMKAVAAQLGAAVLRDADEDAFRANLPAIRAACGDRAVMRAIHFFDDNNRVPKQIAALAEGRFDDYLRMVTESGRSSLANLQNIFSCRHPQQQAVTLTLALCERFLAGRGACRVHGGGFAGTVQAYVPAEECEAFRKAMDSVLGEGACHVLNIRREGAAVLLPSAYNP